MSNFAPIKEGFFFHFSIYSQHVPFKFPICSLGS
jgi:hypothetical protein